MSHGNIFDDESIEFLVLANSAGEYSLWPDFIEVPAGWSISFGPDTRHVCLEWITTEWTDMRPRRPQERQAL